MEDDITTASLTGGTIGGVVVITIAEHKRLLNAAAKRDTAFALLRQARDQYAEKTELWDSIEQLIGTSKHG